MFDGKSSGFWNIDWNEILSNVGFQMVNVHRKARVATEFQRSESSTELIQRRYKAWSGPADKPITSVWSERLARPRKSKISRFDIDTFNTDVDLMIRSDLNISIVLRNEDLNQCSTSELNTDPRIFEYKRPRSMNCWLCNHWTEPDVIK